MFCKDCGIKRAHDRVPRLGMLRKRIAIQV